MRKAREYAFNLITSLETLQTSPSSFKSFNKSWYRNQFGIFARYKKAHSEKDLHYRLESVLRHGCALQINVGTQQDE